MPGFMIRHSDGIYVDMGRLPSNEEFERIIERVFSSGYLLRALEYDRFQHLLYEFQAPGQGTVRLAEKIAPFLPERRPLYRTVKIVGEKAEYFFEPVQLEKSVESPLYEMGDDGVEVFVGVEQKTVYEPTTLDFDEFVAAAWEKGLKFGINARKVKEMIQAGRTERVTIAEGRPATEGTDAGVKEEANTLHRNNAPRRLADGRVDLTQFTNRFPQIREGTRLLMKTPRVLGEPGRSLDGNVIEPPLPQDFELSSLAGEGTRIEEEDGYQYIVAAINGFLNLDKATNKIAVTPKIVNREGVSVRTTGNLALQGSEYEEYGEVQEGRTIEGQSMAFHNDVFGRVMSSGGQIVLKSNLVGGIALNRQGDIVVEGLASSAQLQTVAGTIRIKRAENCVIVADRVEIEWACQCTILAEEVDIVTSEGSAIGGKRVHVALARDRNGEETLISMLLPDLSGFERLLENDRRYIGECEDMIAQMKQGLATLTGQPELQQYLLTAGKLRRKEIALTPQQVGQWQQLSTRMAPALKRIQRAREDIEALEKEIGEVRQRMEGCEINKREASTGVQCALDIVQGDTLVRPMVVLLDAPPMTRMPPKELRATLRGLKPGEQPLFSGSVGNFNWLHEGPESPASPAPG